LRGIVLADTGPLYAARDPDDEQHIRSQSQLGQLAFQNLKVVVPYPTLLESYTLVMRKLGTHSSQEFLKEIVHGSIFENPTPADYRKASSRILRYRDQYVTLVDAVIAEMSVRLEAPVWTFDHHFDVMRVAVWR
jgi:predicted nucleic acid-binding protein